MTKKLTAAMAALACAGCASGMQLDSKSSAVQVASELPAPDETTPAIELTEYRIGPTDKIAISVFNAEDLSSEGEVDASGNFLVPLVGSVAIGGKTPLEAADLVADLLRGRFVKHPQVSVNVLEARARTVTVDGAVAQPGLYPVVGRMTLQRAIATAKGVNEIADTDRVIIFRSIDGQQMAAMFDLDDIRTGRVADPQVFGNDVVVVGQSAMRSFMKSSGMIASPILSRFIPVF